MPFLGRLSRISPNPCCCKPHFSFPLGVVTAHLLLRHTNLWHQEERPPVSNFPFPRLLWPFFVLPAYGAKAFRLSDNAAGEGVKLKAFGRPFGGSDAELRPAPSKSELPSLDMSPDFPKSLTFRFISSRLLDRFSMSLHGFLQYLT